MEVVITTLHSEGTVLLSETEHGRAAGTTVEPDDEGILGGVVLGLNEHIMERFGITDLEVTREETILVKGTHLGQAVDSVGFSGIAVGVSKSEQSAHGNGSSHS